MKNEKFDLYKFIEDLENLETPNDKDLEITPEEEAHLIFINKMFRKDPIFKNYMIIMNALFSNAVTSISTLFNFLGEVNDFIERNNLIERNDLDKK